MAAPGCRRTSTTSRSRSRTACPYEVLTPAHLPGSDHPSYEASRAWGHDWQRSRRSLLLLVPSVVARKERNVPVNPEHPDFNRLTHGLHEPVWWDHRLFG